MCAGKGAVYGYDAVGSYKRDDYGCMGSGQNYIMPILDNLVCMHSIIKNISHMFLCGRLATRTVWTRSRSCLPRRWWPS